MVRSSCELSKKEAARYVKPPAMPDKTSCKNTPQNVSSLTMLKTTKNCLTKKAATSIAAAEIIILNKDKAMPLALKIFNFL